MLPPVERAGDDGARALRREDPVDPEAWPAGVARRRRECEHRVERRPHVVEAAPDSESPTTTGAAERRALEVLGDVELRELERLRVDECRPS